jgi:hypothetical protein
MDMEDGESKKLCFHDHPSSTFHPPASFSLSSLRPAGVIFNEKNFDGACFHEPRKDGERWSRR